MRRAAVVVAVATLAGACDARDDGTVRLSLFAAQSLERPLRDAAAAYEAAHPGVDVELHAAGSQILVAQIEQGAPADVVVTADARSMQRLVDARLVEEPAVVARNRLALIVPATSSIATPADVARPGTKLVLAMDAVPAGAYAQQAFGALGVDVAGRVVSREDSIAGVVAKVQLGEADVGVAYATDAREGLRAIPFPEGAAPDVTYPAAVVAASRHVDAARSLRAFLSTAAGQAPLRATGFLPP